MTKDTISPGTLAEKIALAQTQVSVQSNAVEGGNTPAVVKDGKKEVDPNAKSYQLPSAPCSIPFPWGTVISYESIYTTSDPDEIRELEKCVKVGTLYHARGKSGLREHTTPDFGPRAMANGAGQL